jgi:hypothetical protein
MADYNSLDCEEESGNRLDKEEHLPQHLTSSSPSSSAVAGNDSWSFVASQTVQYEWLKEDQPRFYEHIRQLIRRSHRDQSHSAGGDARRRSSSFIPIGGSYVEFDANIPSGMRE